MLPLLHLLLLASPFGIAYYVIIASFHMMIKLLCIIPFIWWCYKIEEVVNPFNRTSTADIYKDNNNKWYVRNWGQNQEWICENVVKPSSLGELITWVRKNPYGTIKAFGCLHSWSKVAMTKGLAIDMKNLNRILKLDKENMYVHVECGILLRDLFNVLIENDLALETMPNVNHVSVGGVLANAVHGTNASIGTFGDQVIEIQLLTADGNVHVLRRDSEQHTDMFDAALVSFGTLGIVYSVKVNIVPSYAVIKTVDTLPYDKVIAELPELAYKYPHGLMISMYPKSKFAVCVTKTNVNPTCLPTVMSKQRDPMMQLNLALLHKVVRMPDYKFFPIQTWLLSRIPSLATNISCVRWDLAEVLPNHTYRFINMEYGVPESRIQEAITRISERISKSTCKSFLLRIVGPDSRGYMSPALAPDGHLTFYVDIPYRPAERKMFQDVEKIMLSIGGKVSMARWFVDSSPDLFKNINKKHMKSFLTIRKKLDPNHVFTNDLIDLIFPSSI